MRKYMKIRKILLIMLVLLLGFDFSVAVAQLNPPSLTANAVSSSQIDLSWTDPNNGEAGYQIERSLSPTSGFNVIAAVGKNVTSYRDNGLSSGTQYYYKVKVYKQKESVYSNTANATTLAPDTTPPSVSITIPPNNTTYTTAQTVTITASASDNVGVTKVEFYDGSTLKGTDITSPYNYSWSITSADNGTHNWTAKAYDAANNNSVSNVVSLIVNIPAADTTPPSVSITIPANNTTYTTAQTVTITASASDNVGVTKVEFYDGTALKGTDTTNSYTYSWTFTASDNGTHSWTAKAYDAANNNSVSNVVSLIVNIPAADTTPPSVSITIPPNNTTYTTAQTVTITASASDNVGVTKVEFYDGSTLKGTDITSPYNYSWSITSADNGTHNWTAKAYDAANNNSVSNVVSLIVNIPAADTTPPSVSITIPANNTTYTTAQTVTITASASDNVGVTKVEFYDNNSLKGTDITSPYNYSWSITSSDNGTHSWTAKAYDAAGNIGISSNVNLIVNINNPVGGEFIWTKRLGGTLVDAGCNVKTDNSGNIITAGYFMGTVDFGGGPLTSAGGYDIFVAKYDSTGQHIWSKRFGSSEDDSAKAVAVDASGNVLVTGYFMGTVNFGGATLTSLGMKDIFVAKYSSTGAFIWAKSFGYLMSDDIGYDVAVDSSGNVIVTGSFTGFVDFGGGYLQSDPTGPDTFLAKFSPTGAHIWSKNFLSTAWDEGYSISVDDSGNVFITGSFSYTVDFGGGKVTSVGSSKDIYVAKYSSTTGAHMWSKQLGGSGNDIGYSVAVDSSGNVVITGYFSGTVDFGGGPLTSAGSYDIFVAKYSSSGAHLWSKRFGSTSLDSGNSVSVDRVTNEVIITGYFVGTVDFGGGPMTSTGSYDIFVAKYSSTGAHMWSKRFGSTSADMGYGVATDVVGNIVTTGYFVGTVDFGGGPLTSAGSYDIFLLKLGP